MILINKKTKEAIEVDSDSDPVNPREFPNLGTLRLFNGYVADATEQQMKQDEYSTLNEILGNDIDSLKVHGQFTNNKDFFGRISTLAMNNGYYLKPVSCYQHDGVLFYLGATYDGWDIGTVGFIYAKLDDICKWYELSETKSIDFKKVDKEFEAEISAYNEFCNGEVYCLNFYSSFDNIDKMPDESIGSIYNDNLNDIRTIVTTAANYYFNIKDSNYKNWQLATVEYSRHVVISEDNNFE